MEKLNNELFRLMIRGASGKVEEGGEAPLLRPGRALWCAPPFSGGSTGGHP